MQLVRSMIERPIVETNYGSVRGIFMRSRQNRTFYAFLGLPYAMPPVNESRFQVKRDKIFFSIIYQIWLLQF